MCINARLNDEWEEKMRFISEHERISRTDIVKKAVELLYRQLKKQTAASGPLLKRSGFIGRGEGPEDLSRAYKKYLRESIDGKYDNH